MKFYLSGPIQFTEDFFTWRLMIEDFLEREGHVALHPLTYKSKRLKLKLSRMREKLSDQEFVVAVRKLTRRKHGILTYDLKQVEDADALIVYYPREIMTSGTDGEITVAYYLKAFQKQNIDILVVTNHESMDYPVWILGCSDKIFHTFAECKEYIRNTYKDRRSTKNERKEEMEEEFEGETTL